MSRIESYQDILKGKIDEFKHEKGYRAKLASTAGFHPSHLSHVLNGHAHLSFEQGIALSSLWGFSDRLTEFFINLISLARCESEGLKEFYSRKVEESRKNVSPLCSMDTKKWKAISI